MDKKIDLRIIKTYNKLTEAFGEMMREISFDEITVFDLCEKAKVRRATFYKHFDDKYDFFRNIVKIIITNIEKTVTNRTKQSTITEYIILFVREILLYFEPRQAILNNILNSSAFPIIFDIISTCTHESLKNHLEKSANDGVILVTDADSFASFINGGIATLMLFWFRYHHISESELLSKIEAILKKIF